MSFPVKYITISRCLCENCQILDRKEECVCFHEIEQVANKNQEVMESTKVLCIILQLQACTCSCWKCFCRLPYDCITDNPGFHTVCLDRCVLQAAWLDFKHKYGSTAAPEHKISRHCAYRQLVRWCWRVVGREIRVVSDLFDSMTTDAFLPIHYLAMFA